MSNVVSTPNIVKWPSDEETRFAFDSYTLALGKVAHAWNYLHEQLARLFSVVVGAEPAISLGIWYSTTNERAQRDMLRAAFKAAKVKRWQFFPKAVEDFEWAVSNLKCNTGVLDFSVIHFLRGFKAQYGAGAVVEGCRDSVEVAL